MDINDIEVVQLADHTTWIRGRPEISGLGNPLKVFQGEMWDEMRFLYMDRFHTVSELIEVLFPHHVYSRTMFKLRYA